MAITQTISRYNIVDIAKAYNRLDNFGYHGWQKLFDYMKEMSDEMGEDIELDIVGWCCDYTHVESVEDFINQYSGFDVPEDFKNYEVDEQLEVIREYLEDNTSVVCCEEDCIIFQTF